MARVEDLHSVKKHEFTFQWTITNLYVFGRLPSKELVSSKFIVPSLDNSEWYLKLVLSDGIKSSNCFLCRTDSGPESIRIFYSFSVGSSYSHVEIQTFGKTSFSNMSSVINLYELGQKVDKGLAKDVLIECRMWQSLAELIRTPGGTASPYAVFCSTRTVIPVEQRKLLFPVSNFSQQPIGEIATFRVDSALNMLNFKCQLSKVCYLVPGMTFKLKFVNLDEQSLPYVIMYKIQLVDAVKKNHFLQSGQSCVNSLVSLPSSDEVTFLIPSSMLENKNLFIPGDMMLLSCEFSVSDNQVVSFVESTRYDSSDIQATNVVCGWGVYLEEKYNDHRFLFRLMAVLVIILSVIPHLFINDSL